VDGAEKIDAKMSVQIDYITIALITVFTSFFSGIGKEVADELIKWIRKRGKAKLESIKKLPSV
jgi:hypothetical protein